MRFSIGMTTSDMAGGEVSNMISDGDMLSDGDMISDGDMLSNTSLGGVSVLVSF